MKNIEHFGDLTPRMNDFREKVLDKKPYICAERALLATESYRLYQNQPPVMKRALMLKNILEKMSIYIEDETLIVGNQAASNKDAPIFPEYTLEFVIDELDKFEKRDGVLKVQLLPFHQFGEKKYEMLNLEYSLKNKKALHKEDLKEYQNIFINEDIKCFF